MVINNRTLKLLDISCSKIFLQYLLSNSNYLNIRDGKSYLKCHNIKNFIYYVHREKYETTILIKSHSENRDKPRVIYYSKVVQFSYKRVFQ